MKTLRKIHYVFFKKQRPIETWPDWAFVPLTIPIMAAAVGFLWAELYTVALLLR
jgi:hypothetical protein